MDVKTTITEDGKTQVTVTVPAATVKEHIDAHFKQMGKARIPGFRPGKAPRAILERNFGGHEAVYEEITTDMINEIAPVAVDSQDILFIANPDFEETGIVADGEDFTFTLAGEVKPSVELLTYDPVEIKMPAEEATDEEVNAQIEALRTYYYSFETVEGRAVQAEDFVQLNMACTADGNPVQGLNSESRLVELGAGVIPAAMEEQLIGMKTGDSKSFDFSIAGDEDFAYLGVESIHADVAVKEIRVKVVPELDAEFAAKLGVDSIDALKDQIKQAIDQQKGQQLPSLKEQRCVIELAKRVHGDIPAAYVTFTRQDILREFYMNLQQQGVTLDQFFAQQGIDAEEFNKDLDEEAAEVAAQSLALDALFAHLNIEITDADLDEEFKVVDNPAEVRKSWEDNGRMSELREAVRRRKVRQRPAPQRAGCHRGDALRPLGQLPALRGDGGGVRLMIGRAQAGPAPEIFLVTGVHSQRCQLHGFRLLPVSFCR